MTKLRAAPDVLVLGYLASVPEPHGQIDTDLHSAFPNHSSGVENMTNEWRPIDTAPTDVQVRLGRYVTKCSDDGLSLRWDMGVGTAWESKRRWLHALRAPIAVRTFDGGRYTHWQPLPAPPVQS